DSHGRVSNIATVTITVNHDNHPPLAADDSATAAYNGPVTINVLANDSDPDGDALTVTEVSLPAHGSAVINADGTLTYTSNPDFSGTDTFSYTVSDGQGGTASAIVTVTVVDPPDVTVSGTVTLRGCVNPAQSITFEFRPLGDAAPFTRTTTLNADGSFSLD